MRVNTMNTPIHFMPGKGHTACGHNAYQAGGSTLGSRDVRDVTCSRCMGTDEYMGGALAQRRQWEAQDSTEGFTVPEKLALGEGMKGLRTLIGELELYLDAVADRDREIDDLEHALHCIPWWNIRTRQPIKTKLARLRKERGY